MKTPVTARSLKQHFTYNWWKYLLIILLTFGAVDLFYSVTAYRPPEEKKIELYVYGLMNEEKLSAYMDKVRQTEMADMEEMTPVQMTDDATYGPMQLMTYLAAREGDLYLLPREQYISIAQSEALLPLESDQELMDLFNAEGLSLQSGWRRSTETGESHLYGIPQSRIPGLSQYAWAQDGFLGVLAMGGNTENALKFLRILCRDMIPEPSPESSPEPSPAP